METYPYPKSQNSPSESDGAVSDMSLLIFRADGFGIDGRRAMVRRI